MRYDANSRAVEGVATIAVARQLFVSRTDGYKVRGTEQQNWEEIAKDDGYSKERHADVAAAAATASHMRIEHVRLAQYV